MAETKNSTKSGFTADERAAMRERAKELKASKSKADDLADLLAKIAEMPDSDRDVAERLHAGITKDVPELSAKTWYGQPAWANAEGKIVCFFQSSAKFSTRYCTFGFNEAAQLDDGGIWPTSYAIDKLSAADEKTLVALVKKAVG